MLKSICAKKKFQKQPLRVVPGKKCSENMQQIYRRTPMPNCDFNKVALYFCIFRTPFLKNTSGWLLLKFIHTFFIHKLSTQNYKLQLKFCGCFCSVDKAHSFCPTKAIQEQALQRFSE